MVGKLGMRTLVLGSDAAMGANRTGNVKAIENLALATGVFQLEVVDDFGPGLTRVPVNAKPVMPSEPGELPTLWRGLPRPNDAHGARSIRPRKCARGAPPMCAIC